MLALVLNLLPAFLRPANTLRAAPMGDNLCRSGPISANPDLADKVSHRILLSLFCLSLAILGIFMAWPPTTSLSVASSLPSSAPFPSTHVLGARESLQAPAPQPVALDPPQDTATSMSASAAPLEDCADQGPAPAAAPVPARPDAAAGVESERSSPSSETSDTASD